MRILRPAVLLFVSFSTLSAQKLQIVNAASLSSVSIAPGSIATIFGKSLTNGVAFATDVQNPPQSLGGVSVTIGGKAAALFYVSPTQINLVVNAATPVGVQNVTVTAGGGTQTGTVTIDNNAPPGLFSLFGTGTRDGAILNAITFLLGDFSTRTSSSPTYLALFATGLNTSVTPTVTIGGVSVTVAFAGAAPCCAGLQQINVQLPDSLAGAGRVPIVVTQNGEASNVVQVVLLPPQNAQPFSTDQENQTRSRELAGLAYVPGTSLVLSTDENDDVVRVIDVSSKQVTHVVVLPSGANPVGIAVNAAGTTAVVAESGRNKAAIVDLVKFSVTAEVATGMAPVSVAIGGTQAIVVNQDDGTVTIIDLGTNAATKTITVGHGPADVAADATAHKAYVTNEDDGSISVVDLAALSVTQTISLGASVRPEAIALIPSSSIAVVTNPGAGPDGQALLVDLSTGKVVSTLPANPDRSGGATDVAVFNSKVYFANQTGGSVSVLPVNASGAADGPITTIKVDLGARALAIDTKDNLLVVSNEGTGTLVLVNLASNTVAGHIVAVQSNMQGDDGDDDHSDRTGGPNGPTIASVAPAAGKVGATVSVTITGTNLTGATAVVLSTFLDAQGNDHGKANGHDDSDVTVSAIKVNAAGTQLTATIAISSKAASGKRVVRVLTPNGESTAVLSTANTFTVQP